MREEWASGTMADPFTSALQKVEVYSRLRVAEIQFIPVSELYTEDDFLQRTCLFHESFQWLDDCEITGHSPPFYCIQGYREAACLNWSDLESADGAHRSVAFLKGPLKIYPVVLRLLDSHYSYDHETSKFSD